MGASRSLIFAIEAAVEEYACENRSYPISKDTDNYNTCILYCTHDVPGSFNLLGRPNAKGRPFLELLRDMMGEHGRGIPSHVRSDDWIHYYQGVGKPGPWVGGRRKYFELWTAGYNAEPEKMSRHADHGDNISNWD